MTTGEKHDQGKPDWTLLPLEELEGVVKVLMHGAEKYARDNWRRVPEAEQRYFAAAMRHLAAYQRGELLDPESGLPHLDHVLCCLIFLRSFEHGAESRPDIDEEALLNEAVLSIRRQFGPDEDHGVIGPPIYKNGG